MRPDRHEERECGGDRALGGGFRYVTTFAPIPPGRQPDASSAQHTGSLFMGTAEREIWRRDPVTRFGDRGGSGPEALRGAAGGLGGGPLLAPLRRAVAADVDDL